MMRILEGIEGLKSVEPGGVMSIGNFDGVHRGHLHILETAARLRAQNKDSRLIVVTFEPHPLTVLRPQVAPPRLTPPAIKRKILESAGVDDLIILAPTREVLNISAEDFWAIVRDEARPSHLVEGPNFNFGKNRLGTIQRLREWTAASDIQLHVLESIEVALLDLQIVQVSSSLIRWLLTHGRVRDAAICLARLYALQGKVIEGHHRGKSIGVPTANLRCEDQLIPADGVYAARCTLDGATYAAALSIGKTPTFGEDIRQVEAHLIDFDGNLYGHSIEIELIDWLRDQMKYPGVDALREQIARDIDATRQRQNLPAEVAIALV